MISSFQSEKLRFLGASLEDLPTPCLLVERQTLERNVDAMQGFLNKHEKSLRAHVKTHKSSHLAAMQMQRGAIGLCVAKLSEAEILIREGLDNVLITGPVASQEAQARLVECTKDAANLMVTIDDLSSARRLARALDRAGLSLRYLIDLDVGFHRTGATPEAALNLVRELKSNPCLVFQGLQAYAGHIQHIPSFEERGAKSRQAIKIASDFFRTCQDIGLEPEILSVGGTGSVQFDVEFPEVTEVQAGSYVFMDAEYFANEWGSLSDGPGPFETSLSVLSTVVSANHDEFVTVDAGLKTMYRDGGIPEVLEPADSGMVYEWFGDEYGKVSDVRRGGERLSIGRKVRLSVSHCDPTVNLFDMFFVVEGNKVVDVWPVDMRGCSQ